MLHRQNKYQNKRVYKAGIKEQKREYNKMITCAFLKLEKEEQV